MEEQKKYKIKKLEKYSEEWKEDKNIINTSLAVGFAGLGLLSLGIGGTFEYFNIPKNIQTDFINIGLTTFTVQGLIFEFCSIKGLICSLKDKIYLENKIDKINYELDQYEESKTRSRR